MIHLINYTSVFVRSSLSKILLNDADIGFQIQIVIYKDGARMTLPLFVRRGPKKSTLMQRRNKEDQLVSLSFILAD